MKQKAGKKNGTSGRNQHQDVLTLPAGIRLGYPAAAILLILLLTFLLYSTALRNEFLNGWDDGEYLTAISGQEKVNMPEIFSTFHLGMYQPLAVLSFAINFKLSGAQPWAFILTNILLHLINTFLIFRLMERWMKGWFPAAAVALLFAIHPMHVEGVAWISTRSSGLYSLFFLAGLITWDKYLDNGLKIKDYSLTLLFATLALFSKSMAATFPVVLLLMDYLKRRKYSHRVITEKLPFFVLSVIFGLVAIRASASFGHITVLEQDFNPVQRLFLILYGISFYLIKLFVPVNLSAIYAFPATAEGGLPAFVYSSVLVVAAAAAFVAFRRKNRRETVFGGLFFLVTIGMVLPLFWSRIFITADRYTYIPYLGLFMIIARYADELRKNRFTLDSTTLKLVYIASALIILSLSAATLRRIRVWHDTPTLLTDVVDKKRSDADMAHAYFYLGNYHDGLEHAGEALKYYDLAISRNPQYILALNNRGILKGKAGETGSAIADFDRCISLKPDYAEAWYNRGVAVFQKGDPAKACADWKESARLGFKPAVQAIGKYCRNNPPASGKALQANGGNTGESDSTN